MLLGLHENSCQKSPRLRAVAHVQPIPDKTQAHVDRLIGSRVGELTVLDRATEGRFSTLYWAERAGTKVMLEVLRVGVTSHDEDVRAVDALACAGVVTTRGFLSVPDGRRARVLDALEGESLDHLRLRRGPLPAVEVVALLRRIGSVLQVTHAWALAHGSLEASCVWVNGETVRLLDFGLVKSPPREGDVKALGALGYSLLTGHDVERPPTNAVTPAPLDAVLRDAMDERVTELADVLKALEAISFETDKPRVVGPPAVKRKPVWPFAALMLALVAVAAAFFFWPKPSVETADDAADDALLEAANAPQPDVVPSQRLDEDDDVVPQRPTVKRPVAPPAVPSAQALQDIITRFERTLRAQAKSGDDVSQAMSVLNKQRLRLTGSPTTQDRQDVARQLAGWKRSYLRR